jgi:hypothetical protein
MPVDFKKLHLSGTTDGNVLAIAATATPGTTIHTATTSTSTDSYDEVYLWASNTSTAAINMTLWLGNANNEQDGLDIRVPAAFNGPICVLPGIPLRNGRVLQATVVTANRIIVFGYVNRTGNQP